MADGDGRVAGLVQGLYQPEGGPRVDFRQPAGEPALAAPDSVSWRVFKNPVSLFVGGVTAVILELAEPRVRTGVWEHSSFRAIRCRASSAPAWRRWSRSMARARSPRR
jgi:uncharacterized protein (DUF2236 family)